VSRSGIARLLKREGMARLEDVIPKAEGETISAKKTFKDYEPGFGFAMKDKKPSGQHAFDKVCAGMEIEHRLAPPRHPKTNGMVERFNGRISELLQQTRFDSRADLEATLLNYPKLYNHHIPQRAIGTKTPIQALKEWQDRKPELFVKRVYSQTGLDN
ncbi:integrase core domain-containing protein, partial [Janthinobacterium fluminis]